MASPLQAASAPPPDPYSNGLQVSGSGSNANFGVTWNPQTGMYQTTVGNTPLPIFTQAQWQGINQGYGTTNQGITQGGSFMPNWVSQNGASPTNALGNTGSDVKWNSAMPRSAYTGANAPTFGGGVYSYQRPGTADTTTAHYSLDPATGYYVPSNIQSVNGGESWWQRNGVTAIDQAIPIIASLGSAAGLFGGADAATAGATDAATSGVTDSSTAIPDSVGNSTSLFSGDTLPGTASNAAPVMDSGALPSLNIVAPAVAPTGGLTTAQVLGGLAGVGAVGGALSAASGSGGAPQVRPGQPSAQQPAQSQPNSQPNSQSNSQTNSTTSQQNQPYTNLAKNILNRVLTPGAPQQAAAPGAAPAAPSSGGSTVATNFGINTVPAPAQGSQGALGSVPYQMPNPWANHLLPTPPPVNPNDPAANLFRSFNPNLVTPGNSGAGTPMGGAPSGAPTSPYPMSIGPQMRPQAGGVPVNPSGPGMMGGVVMPGTSGSGTGGPPAMPVPPPSGPGGMAPSGGRFPGFYRTPTQTGRGPNGWQIGGVPRPSPLIAASNPASGAPQPWMGMMPGTMSGQPNASQPPQAGGGAIPSMAGWAASPNAPVSNTPPPTPQQMAALIASGMAVMAHGGHYAAGGPPDGTPPWAQLSPQDVQAFLAAQGTPTGNAAPPMSNSPLGQASAPMAPTATPAPGTTPQSREQIIAQLLSHNPTHGPRPSTGDPQLDAMLQNQYGGGSWGDNSAQGVIGRLQLRPQVLRAGQPQYAEGGSPLGMAAKVAPPPSMGSRHVSGPSGGQDDDVNAKLSDGEYVLDADVVSALGDGNNEAGAKKLDQFRQNVRTHKRKAPVNDIPPKAKAPESYMPKGKKSAAKKSAEAALAAGKR